MGLLELPHLLNKKSVAHIGVVGFDQDFVLVFFFGETVELKHSLSNLLCIYALKYFSHLIFCDVELLEIGRLISLSDLPLPLDLPDFFVQEISELSKDLFDNLQVNLLG